MESDQLFRCLLVLYEHDRPMTCQEIAGELEKARQPIRENNIAKTLRAAPELVNELRISQRRVQYQIGSAGRAYVTLMRKGLASM
jgi:repressor of nif and glnA expression